jgi:hypothetical protein
VVLGRSCRLRPLDQPPRPTQAALRRLLRDPPTRLPTQRCLMRHKRHRRVEQPSPQQVGRTGRTRASTGRPRVCDSAYAASRGLPNARSGPTGSYRSSDVEVQAVFAGRSSRPSTSARRRAARSLPTNAAHRVGVVRRLCGGRERRRGLGRGRRRHGPTHQPTHRREGSHTRN